jgi:hypothetical protein
MVSLVTPGKFSDSAYWKKIRTAATVIGLFEKNRAPGVAEEGGDKEERIKREKEEEGAEEVDPKTEKHKLQHEKLVQMFEEEKAKERRVRVKEKIKTAKKLLSVSYWKGEIVDNDAAREAARLKNLLKTTVGLYSSVQMIQAGDYDGFSHWLQSKTVKDQATIWIGAMSTEAGQKDVVPHKVGFQSILAGLVMHANMSQGVSHPTKPVPDEIVSMSREFGRNFMALGGAVSHVYKLPTNRHSKQEGWIHHKTTQEHLQSVRDRVEDVGPTTLQWQQTFAKWEGGLYARLIKDECTIPVLGMLGMSPVPMPMKEPGVSDDYRRAQNKRAETMQLEQAQAEHEPGQQQQPMGLATEGGIMATHVCTNLRSFRATSSIWKTIRSAQGGGDSSSNSKERRGSERRGSRAGLSVTKGNQVKPAGQAVPLTSRAGQQRRPSVSFSEGERPLTR